MDEKHGNLHHWNGLMETSPNWQLPILWSGVAEPSLEWTDGCLSSGDFPYSIGMDRWKLL